MILNNGYVPVMLVLWGMQSIHSLPELPGPLWPGVVAPNKVLSIGQIELNCELRNYLASSFTSIAISHLLKVTSRLSEGDIERLPITIVDRNGWWESLVDSCCWYTMMMIKYVKIFTCIYLPTPPHDQVIFRRRFEFRVFFLDRSPYQS